MVLFAFHLVPEKTTAADLQSHAVSGFSPSPTNPVMLQLPKLWCKTVPK